MLVSEVHPVAILSPSFCVTCSAVSCLSEIIGAYIVPAYSSMGLVTVLYVFVKVSLFLPQWVEVRAFSILIVFSALSFEVLICSLNVSLGSKVSPSILGLRIVGSRVLSSCSDSSSLYSAGSGVKSVVIVLLALSFRSFAFVQVCTSSKYG